jgi:hypothetical protein
VAQRFSAAIVAVVLKGQRLPAAPYEAFDSYQGTPLGVPEEALD